ncbi:NAD-dependent epimerase/dehydratase family protein [Candidatus Marimicrobium litorale]|uniref:NAD-dependent epimerase/dehydratase family protein n=1 Tax=Candidatus Marimicrobium litorale TaxID=2518991 RepID=UPI00242FA1C7|nr:NAD-dependent epimerase/dehydratase family protein [Candidatus Marimicrobium litorale]
MKLLVTGATGFIGRALCRRLVAEGSSLTALSRSGMPVSSDIASLPVDLKTELPDRKLLDGVDTIIHLAGVAHRKADTETYEALNHEAAVRLARLAADEGVKRFVYLSSVKAMGEPIDDTRRSESNGTPPTEPYGLSKWRAEQGLHEVFADRGLSVIIIRPTLVYGPGVKGNLQVLLRSIRRGLPRPPGGGERSMIALDDLAELLQQVVAHAPDGLHTWIACGDKDYSTQAVYDLMREAQGLGQGRGWLPGWAWQVGTVVTDIFARRPLGTTRAQLFCAERYTNGAAKAAMDWAPSRSLEQLARRIVSDGET